MIEIWNKMVTKSDMNSFQVIYKRYYQSLYAYAKKFSGNNDIAKDAIQNAFLNVWNYKNNLEKNIDPLPYLLRCVRNEIIRIQKTEAKIVALHQEKNTAYFVKSEINESNLDEGQVSRLVLALNKLPSRQKEILYFRYYENVSYKNISDILSINYQSVVNQAHRAILSLRGEASIDKSNFF